MSDFHDFFTKYVVLEKGHGAGKKGMAQEKRAWRNAMLKLARGNTMFIDEVDASKQDDYLHKYNFFFYHLTALYFFLSPMCASYLARNHVILYSNNI